MLSETAAIVYCSARKSVCFPNSALRFGLSGQKCHAGLPLCLYLHLTSAFRLPAGQVSAFPPVPLWFPYSNVKRIGKLGFGVLLTFLHGVPEGCPVKIFFRGMGRQHDFTSNHTAFSRVVADLSIVAAEKTFPGTVGCAGNGALTGTSFNLVD